jgi:tight adherence protein B
LIDLITALGASGAVLVAASAVRLSLRRSEVSRLFERWEMPATSRRRFVARPRINLKVNKDKAPLLAALATAVSKTKLGAKLHAHASRNHASRPFSDVLALWTCGALAGILSGWIFFGGGPLSIVLAAAGPLVTDRLMIRAGGRRTARIEQQLPEAFSLQSAALRAGNSMTATLGILAKEIPSPLREELAMTMCEIEIGQDLDDGLGRMAERVGSRDVNLWVTAMAVHRRTGGSLSKVLESLAGRIRERTQMRAEIRALTAQGRLSGLVVAAAPIGFFLLLSATSRSQMRILYTTPLGILVLAIGVTFQVAGFFWIRRILRIRA